MKGLNVRRGFVSEEISFVGAGRSGSMFAIFFKGLGYPVKFIIDCIPEKAVELSKRVPGAIAGGMELLKELSGAVFISVNDDAIRDVFLRIWEQNTSPEYFFHFSGAHSSALFEEAAKAGKGVGSLHPNISISDPEKALRRIRNVDCIIEGNEKGLRFLTNFLHKASLSVSIIGKKDKVLYHTAAVFSANFTQVLFEISRRLYVEAGLPDETARRIVSNYASVILERIKSEDLIGTLTGPAIRNDVETIKKETEELKKLSQDLSELYELLSKTIISFKGRGNLEYKADN